MNSSQLQQEISIIKKMIEKTRQETAESGHFFIFLGIFGAICTFVIGIFDIYNLNHLDLPALIIMAIISGIIGYLVVSKEEKSEKVIAYPRTIFLSLWFICGLTIISVVFLFPFLEVYSFAASSVLVSLFLGIAVSMTGVIYEVRSIIWCSSVWWIAALLMALISSRYNFLIMIFAIITGWILPGLILNRKYKKRSVSNEA